MPGIAVWVISPDRIKRFLSVPSTKKVDLPFESSKSITTDRDGQIRALLPLVFPEIEDLDNIRERTVRLYSTWNIDLFTYDRS